MIIYNVTIKVHDSIAEEWLKWMREEHMPELNQTGLFIGYRLSRLLEQDEIEDITYIAQYFCTGLEQYDAYISEYSQQMREKGFKRFGDKFIAFRTVMETEFESFKM
jgi:hypothetical protein